MRVVIAGGHGQIALKLSKQLSDAGHQPVGLIRNPDHVADLEQAGADPVVVDLESAAVNEVAAHLAAADAVIFAAGAGPNSTAARKQSVDRNGAVLLAQAAAAAGVRRYVMVSAIGADDFDPDSDEIFQVYLRAKSEADAALRDTSLDWTIVRPGGLTDDDPTGRVTAAPSTGRGQIPRADVAAVLVAALLDASSIGKQFELISGDVPIAEALAALP
ncbi:NAD(P)H-binding protein [Jatrophihabitans endophyticus]|uniref:NAD(P)H-binding protein n=1 Tax=Jatrophihabitans endophyticus TaxID=1206085 RepID=UPI0019FA4C54|nr:NAD(P)H-binding protein [Jatrophihabitans endophyticus]MBE7187823.1 NAD(P)H-binding protein [Jatrophihabitans endophyticus]